MRQSASRHDDDDSPLTGLIRDGLSAAGSAVSRNPVLVGGTTAFLVTLFYVSANALWYQPQKHPGAFFTTREPADTTLQPAQSNETTSAVPARLPDPRIKEAQRLLAELTLYSGTVDGLSGPQTRKAVEDYQRLAGLPATGEVDDALLRVLGDQAVAPPHKPVSRPAAHTSAQPVSAQPVSAQPSAPASRETVSKVQAALKAFGHDGIEIDGALGSRTRGAIREFQSLFALPVTGEVDAALLAKMQEIGLTN